MNLLVGVKFEFFPRSQPTSPSLIKDIFPRVRFIYMYHILLNISISNALAMSIKGMKTLENPLEIWCRRNNNLFTRPAPGKSANMKNFITSSFIFCLCSFPIIGIIRHQCSENWCWMITHILFNHQTATTKYPSSQRITRTSENFKPSIFTSLWQLSRNLSSLSACAEIIANDIHSMRWWLKTTLSAAVAPNQTQT